MLNGIILPSCGQKPHLIGSIFHIRAGFITLASKEPWGNFSHIQLLKQTLAKSQGSGRGTRQADSRAIYCIALAHLKILVNSISITTDSFILETHQLYICYGKLQFPFERILTTLI